MNLRLKEHWAGEGGGGMLNFYRTFIFNVSSPMDLALYNLVQTPLSHL